MAKRTRKSKAAKTKALSPFKNYWTKNNYILLLAGLGVIFIGFLLMAQGPWDNPVSLTVSPLLLLLAYLVIFPAAILYKKKSNKNDSV